MTAWNSRVFACFGLRPVSWWPVEPLSPSDPGGTLPWACREHGGRQHQHFQRGTRLELVVDRARPAHTCQNLSPARKLPPFLPNGFLLGGEGRWCPPFPGQPFEQAVGAFERQTATGRLWKQEGLFHLCRPQPEHWFLYSTSSFKVISHADMNVITQSREVP